MKSILKLSLSLLSILSLAGCIHGGTYRFTGPGSFQDFATVRYQCLQETKTRTSGAFVNQYGGAASSDVTPSCTAFDACLASKGYYRNPNGTFDASSIPITCR